MQLPKDLGISRSGYNFPRESPLKVELKRKDDERTTRVEVVGGQLGRDAFELIGPMLRAPSSEAASSGRRG